MALYGFQTAPQLRVRIRKPFFWRGFFSLKIKSESCSKGRFLGLSEGTGVWFCQKVKDPDRKGQVQANRKKWCKEVAHVSSRPPQPLAKSERLPQHQHGVFTQVANEFCTFNRYVTSSVLWNGQARIEISFQLLSFHFLSYLDPLWRLRVFSRVSTAWLSCQINPFRLSEICSSCHPLATCEAQNGSNAGCFCKHGYTGDGTTFCNGEYINAALSPALSEDCLRWNCCCSLLSTRRILR